MSVYVFLGPSLPVEQARAVLDAHYLPPVSCGDVTELVLDREPPSVIGIVDGLFEQVPAVWHKEILFAMSRGVRVVGASSMGALRAAELHAFGMDGVGSVFEDFRDGRLTDDDEVTIVHAPGEDGYRPLSEAMVNLRAGLAGARQAGAIGAATHDALLAAAKRTFYPDRSWGQVYADGRKAGLPQAELDALREHVRTTRPDAKRDDALALLARIRDLVAEGVQPPVCAFDFEPTYYWEKLLRTVRQQRGERAMEQALGVPAATALAQLAEQQPEVTSAALLDTLVRREAEHLGVLVPEEIRARHAEEGGALREVISGHLRGDLTGPVLRELEQRGLLASARAALAAGRDAPEGDSQPAVPLPSGRRE
ncbi:TfuA-like protein [Kitasatospora sp. NPDC052896]|uniref:TfuA-like protein n=1 Tax=Kitasatospora sp. NPDC052896 TaxID=3364061 RepID=UPI0037CA2213